MWNRSILAMVVALGAAALVGFLRDTALAIAIESAVQRAADYFEIPRATMIASASPFVCAFLVIGLISWISYQIGANEFAQKTPLVIEYRWNDTRHVEPISNPTGGTGASRYYVEIFNRSTTKTIEDVAVDRDKTAFTNFIDAQMRRSFLLRSPGIHPLQRERVFLFGLDDRMVTQQTWEDVLGHTSFFTVRARGKDAAETSQKFEYSPIHFPKVCEYERFNTRK